MSVVSLPTVLRIAANVFKESVRDKVLYSIVLFAVLIISASLLKGTSAHTARGVCGVAIGGVTPVW